MIFTVEQIARVLEGKIEGDEKTQINKISKIEEATEGSITFLSNPKYEDYIYTTNASVVIINDSFILKKSVKPTLIRVKNSYDSLSILLDAYDSIKSVKNGIDSDTFISDTSVYGENLYLGRFSYIGENVKIGNDVKIYPQVYLGDNCVVGNNVKIYAGAKIYSDTKIGDNCIIHSNVTLGADGFGFSKKEDGTYKKVPQIGNVVIESNVEIGAGTTIDRATMGSTLIKKGVKIDNLVQVAHNVEVGENTIIVSQVGIAGSSKIGNNCTIAGQVGIVGHIKIGDNVTIGAQSGVIGDITDNMSVLGSPAIDSKEAKRSMILLKNIDKIIKRISDLEKKIN